MISIIKNNFLDGKIKYIKIVAGYMVEFLKVHLDSIFFRVIENYDEKGIVNIMWMWYNNKR